MSEPTENPTTLDDSAPTGAHTLPEVTFAQMPLTPEVRQALEALGYERPTPVQALVYEPAVQGKSLVVQARTGTGKTSAFGLPLVDQIVRKGEGRAQVLILTPTRELALQVSRELDK